MFVFLLFQPLKQSSASACVSFFIYFLLFEPVNGLLLLCFALCTFIFQPLDGPLLLCFASLYFILFLKRSHPLFVLVSPNQRPTERTNGRNEQVKRDTSATEVNELLKTASKDGPLKGILGFETRPLVSTDYTNDERSGIVDARSTMVVDGTCVKARILLL